MAIPHPIPYQGSKRQLAAEIMPYIPRDTSRFVEAFAGSAALSLALASQTDIPEFIFNDINAPLMRLWEQILQQPKNLTRWYRSLWEAQIGREQRFYNAVRQRFNQTHAPHYLLYLLARCVKAAVRYNAQGEFNQSPDNRRKGRQPLAMTNDIYQAAQLLADKTRLFSQDYSHFMRQISPNDILYLDPPYEGISKQDPRYIKGTERTRFIQVLDSLNERGIAYLVSYDGRTGQKQYGATLPDYLGLKRIELHAGRSSQATLLGRSEQTIESLYLSPALQSRLEKCGQILPQQALLLGDSA